mgnify:FL=1
MDTNRITEIKETQKNWNRETQLLFCTHISFATTICIRDIWAVEALIDTDKISGMKQLNELQHYVMLNINRIVSLQDDDGFPVFTINAIKILQQSDVTKGYIPFIIFKSFEKSHSGASFKIVSPTEYLLLNQALNEICGGPEAIPDWEFHTRVGLNKEDALSVLSKLDRDWLDNFDRFTKKD